MGRGSDRKRRRSSKIVEERESSEETKPSTTDLDGFLGTYFYKEFEEHGVYLGYVQSYTKPFFHLFFEEDGDEEDVSASELRQLLRPKLQQSLKAKFDKTKQKKASRKENLKDPSVGTTIEKSFPGHGVLTGTIMSYQPKPRVYHVKYNDGETTEDLKPEELKQLKKEMEERKSGGGQGTSSTPGTPTSVSTLRMAKKRKSAANPSLQPLDEGRILMVNPVHSPSPGASRPASPLPLGVPASSPGPLGGRLQSKSAAPSPAPGRASATSAVLAQQLINSSDNVVEEMIEGILASNPLVTRLQNHRVILRKVTVGSNVAIVSGGGSGHEPAHAGYIGSGMLSAVVLGNVFASPDPDSIFAAIMAVKGSAGVLLLIKNYTGDRLNFGLAQERARAEGVDVEMVIVGDDCALNDANMRRGLAGTVFVHKIAGFSAESGDSLQTVKRKAEAAAKSIGTVGVGLSGCALPGKVSTSTLAKGEMEIGLGIHGEPGAKREPLENADTVVERMIALIHTSKFTSFKANDRVAVMVNNLGATPHMECYVALRKALHCIETNLCLAPIRTYAGHFMTALDMSGISISIFKLTDEFRMALDAPTTAPSWPRDVFSGSEEKIDATTTKAVESNVNGSPLKMSRSLSEQGKRLEKCIREACSPFLKNDVEAELTRLDSATGDGDCGETLRRGSQAILDELPTMPLNSAKDTMKALSKVAGKMGGSSGALYGILFASAERTLADMDSSQPSAWVSVLKNGIEALSKHGGAKKGDRTMLDALIPALEALKGASGSRNLADAKASVLEAAKAAETGARLTKQLKPKAGRSSYVDYERCHGNEDPGAKAASIWLRGIATALENE